MTAEPLPGADRDIARHVWETRYRAAGSAGSGDRDLAATWQRIAHALAAPESRDREQWEARFAAALRDFRFLPGGRIQAGAGRRARVTLLNCFVMGRIEDSLDGIFRALAEGARTMQHGGGVGYDFSTLRPRGAPARASGGTASGPVSFMHLFDSMCATVHATGARRGAMMGTLRCDHPDIEAFVDAKRDPHALRHFNLSVLASDAFMAAVAADAEWALVFPESARNAADREIVVRPWPGAVGERPCRVHRRIRARALWDRMMRAAYDCAEPGVLFADRLQQFDPAGYAEEIVATNPCGEIPLPAYGACDLGSVNLTQFVRAPFTSDAVPDWEGIAATAAIGVRMLDNVYEVTRFPLRRQAEVARATRRLGIGFTGLADAMMMLGMRYGAAESILFAGDVMRTICHAAYRTSVALAREKGAFPACDPGRHVRGAFVAGLPADLVRAIRRHGLRNSHLTAVAPTGTISLLAGNVSSGVEPAFAFTLQRTVNAPDGRPRTFAIEDYAYRRFRETHGPDVPLPPAFVAAAAVAPHDQLALQAAVQRHVDNAVAKTVTVPAAFPFAAFRDIYADAYRLGLKGCAAYRPNPVTGTVVLPDPAPAP